MSDRGIMRRFYKGSVSGIFCLGTVLLNGTFIYADTLGQTNPQETTDTSSDASPEEINLEEQEITNTRETVPSQDLDIVNSLPGMENLLQLTANSKAENEMTLSWQHLAGTTSYQIFRDNTLIETVLHTNEELFSYDDTAVIPNQTYEYKVIVMSEIGTEMASERVMVNSFDTIPPEAPTNFTALEVTMSNQIDFTWKGVEDAKGYTLYRDGVLLTELSEENTSFSDLTAQPNLTYHYAIEAFDASGNISPAADISVITLDTLPPSIPKIVEGRAVAANQVHLLWTPSTDNRNMSHYNIYLKRTSGDFLYVGKSFENRFIHEGLGNDVLYQYKITAVDEKGNESQFSEIYEVETNEDPTAVVYEPLLFTIERDDIPIIKIPLLEKTLENENIPLMGEEQIVSSNMNDNSTNENNTISFPDSNFTVRMEEKLEDKEFFQD